MAEVASWFFRRDAPTRLCVPHRVRSNKDVFRTWPLPSSPQSSQTIVGKGTYAVSSSFRQPPHPDDDLSQPHPFVEVKNLAETAAEGPVDALEKSFYDGAWLAEHGLHSPFPVRRMIYVAQSKCTSRIAHMEAMLSYFASGIKHERSPGVNLMTNIENQPADVINFMARKRVTRAALEGEVVHISSYNPFIMETVPVAVEWSIYFAHLRAIERVASLTSDGVLGEHDAVIIFEDDVTLEQDWQLVYNASTQLLAPDWEVVKLFWNYPFPKLFSMAAYAVHAGKAAGIVEKLLSFSQTNMLQALSVVERNVDTELAMSGVSVELTLRSCADTFEVQCDVHSKPRRLRVRRAAKERV